MNILITSIETRTLIPYPMLYEEVMPYLNKIVQVNLKNKKRKLGWLVVDHYHQFSEEPLKEVHCVKVRFGESNILQDKQADLKKLKHKAETFRIEDIKNIRSCI